MIDFSQCDSSKVPHKKSHILNFSPYIYISIIFLLIKKLREERGRVNNFCYQFLLKTTTLLKITPLSLFRSHSSVYTTRIQNIFFFVWLCALAMTLNERNSGKHSAHENKTVHQCVREREYQERRVCVLSSSDINIFFHPSRSLLVSFESGGRRRKEKRMLLC